MKFYIMLREIKSQVNIWNNWFRSSEFKTEKFDIDLRTPVLFSFQVFRRCGTTLEWHLACSIARARNSSGNLYLTSFDNPPTWA